MPHGAVARRPGRSAFQGPRDADRGGDHEASPHGGRLDPGRDRAVGLCDRRQVPRAGVGARHSSHRAGPAHAGHREASGRRGGTSRRGRRTDRQAGFPAQRGGFAEARAGHLRRPAGRPQEVPRRRRLPLRRPGRPALARGEAGTSPDQALQEHALGGRRRQDLLRLRERRDQGKRQGGPEEGGQGARAVLRQGHPRGGAHGQPPPHQGPPEAVPDQLGAFGRPCHPRRAVPPGRVQHRS